jgi:lipoic acid synthetase
MVLTAVTRDDVADGGASHIAETIRAIQKASPMTTIEVLTPDFAGDVEAIHTVLSARPEVFSHNIETVERLYPAIRSNRFDYKMALGVLKAAADFSGHRAIIKSALMVGHGESGDEVRATMEDLRGVGVESISLGQYLRPTKKQVAVKDFIHPDQFQEYESLAYELGFSFAVAGPFVRSSYRSEELLEQPFARERFDQKGAAV